MTQLCDICKSLPYISSKHILETINLKLKSSERCSGVHSRALFSWEEGSTAADKLYKHHKSSLDLAASASKCDLCRLMSNLVQTAIERDREPRWYETCSQKEDGEEAFILDDYHLRHQQIYAVSIHWPNPLPNPPFRQTFSLCCETREQGVFLLLTELCFSILDSESQKIVLTAHADALVLPGTFSQALPKPLRAEPDFSLRLANSWYQECVLQAGRHRHTIEDSSARQTTFTATDVAVPPLFPSRVIDVGDGSNNPAVHLLLAKGHRGRWAALSHCWGGFQPSTTTRASLEDRVKGINVSELPSTFSHAIQVTRQVGLRYLWIDSLCICQDDNEDWNRESAEMHSIYTNASVVISALHADNAGEGLFFTPRLTHDTYLDITEFSKAKGNVTEDSLCLVYPLKIDYSLLRFSGDPYDLLRERALMKRGWALQEQCLAQRTLHFSDDELFFSCQHGLFSESSCGYSMTNARFLGTDAEYVSERHENVQLDRQHYSWETLVREYTRRSLTFPTDRLVALSGFAAKHLSEHPHAKYMAGLWLDSLMDDLSWDTASSPPVDPYTQYIAPSWSWASCPDQILYRRSRKRKQIAKYVDHFIELVSPANPFGAVGPGSWLVLEGPMLPLRVSVGEGYAPDFQVSTIADKSQPLWHGEANPDCSLPLPQDDSTDSTLEMETYALVLFSQKGKLADCLWLAPLTAKRGESYKGRAMRRIGNLWLQRGDTHGDPFDHVEGQLTKVTLF